MSDKSEVKPCDHEYAPNAPEVRSCVRCGDYEPARPATDEQLSGMWIDLSTNDGKIIRSMLARIEADAAIKAELLESLADCASFLKALLGTQENQEGAVSQLLSEARAAIAKAKEGK